MPPASPRIPRSTLIAFLLLSAWTSASAQTNRQVYHNGIDYFFANAVLPPSDFSTITRAFGSATSIGNRSGGAENAVHALGVQQDGIEAWTAQATTTPSLAQPLGFSLLELRRGGTWMQRTGSVVATGSWMTSLPCGAPWSWVVTFTWGTPYTQTSTQSGSRQGFAFSLRGETNQALVNQNYFLGSGNERNLNSGGLSFFEDTSVNLAYQLAGRQEWSQGYFQIDALNETNRDPSGALSAAGFDTASIGTGGTRLRAANTTINPGKPSDRVSYFLQAEQQRTGTSNTSILLIAARNLGGGLTADARGSFGLAGDGRRTNLISDPLLTAIGLDLPLAFSTGGVLTPLTGDIGRSGIAQTIPQDLSAVSIPASLQPLRVNTQALGIQLPAFSVISNGDHFVID